MCLANVHTGAWAWIAKQVPVIAICVVAVATLGRTRRPATFLLQAALFFHLVALHELRVQVCLKFA